MSTPSFSHEQIVQIAKFSQVDLNFINSRRRAHNRLGFAYQLAFVRLTNRFPGQQPFEVIDDILTFVGLQLDLPVSLIQIYQQRRETITEHQPQIRQYLELKRFEDAEIAPLEQFLLEEASRLEQIGPLLTKAKQFLKEHGILQPADDTLRRLIVNQREQARQMIYNRLTESLSDDLKQSLDTLLEVGETRISLFQTLKRTPSAASSAAMQRLFEKLAGIRATGILAIDLAWLNNNYQRTLTRYAQRCSADRLRKLETAHRYPVLACFLQQVYRDTLDYIVEMNDKVLTGVYSRAQTEVDAEMKRQRKTLRTSLHTFQTLGQIILDEGIEDKVLRESLFQEIDKEVLTAQIEAVNGWLTGKYSHVFHRVTERFSYLRQFAPELLEHLEFKPEEGNASALFEGIKLLRELNAESKRKLPEDAPTSFIPKNLQPFIEAEDGTLDKRAWECALLTVIRDEIKAGNVYIGDSKRFGCFDDFFIPDTQWQAMRSGFFKRAGLPENGADVPDYLTKRLNIAYDDFLAQLPDNTYASIDDQGWQLSVDQAEKLDDTAKGKLDDLNHWLSDQLRVIKLPELLIEVDNDLHFCDHFMMPAQQTRREAQDICATLATVMAHGCNIGPYTMARLTEGISYPRIKHITDWQLTPEAQRQALAQLVNAISQLGITQTWGSGRTSSSDGQRFQLTSKVLQRSYSHKLSDYAIEFYSFIADNYAPFYSTVIECTDRDAAYVLDGLLYNESDLALAEHYTDTHGFTEINFAAFAMLGRRFAPRIRGLKQQRIYRLDDDKDYGSLDVLVGRRDRRIHLDWITDQWDRIGHFYASLENGHTTASTALKRVASFTGKNIFYRANRELGRVFKTEHILKYMSDPSERQKIRRGLLKGEQMHALARQVAYGKQGKISNRDLQDQKNSSSCLTLIMACIIYWQAKEINRLIQEGDPEGLGLDLSLLEHISPIGWENIILYGEYVLNPNLVRA